VSRLAIVQEQIGSLTATLEELHDSQTVLVNVFATLPAGKSGMPEPRLEDAVNAPVDSPAKQEDIETAEKRWRLGPGRLRRSWAGSCLGPLRYPARAPAISSRRTARRNVDRDGIRSMAGIAADGAPLGIAGPLGRRGDAGGTAAPVAVSGLAAARARS
jgi:hypothetical protein